MVNLISASNSQQAGAAAQPVVSTSASTSAAAQTQAPAKQPADQVKLSLSAQILTLRHQNMSINQIAANLGMPAKEVSSYLPGSAPVAPAAAAASPADAPVAPASAPPSAPAAASGSPATPVAAKG